MSLRVFLSPAAHNDLVELHAQGIEQFGLPKADAYLQVLEHALFQELPAHPLLGMSRPELGAGVRSLYRGSHHLFYRLDADAILVVRVLHERMNVTPLKLTSNLQQQIK